MQTTDVSPTDGSRFSRFMASGHGRIARVATGLGLMGAGLFLLPSPTGLVVAALGLIPVAAGAFNRCPVAPAWGGHFVGARYCARPDPRDADNR